MDKISTKLLAESQVDGIFSSLNMLESYREDFQRYYDEYSHKENTNDYDSQNITLTNEDDVKFNVEAFEHLYSDFLDKFHILIYQDIGNKTNNESFAFSYNIDIDGILDNSDIESYKRLLKDDEINDLNINPYDFMFKKLKGIYNDHKENFEDIFNKEGSILSLGEQVKSILAKDFGSGKLAGFLSVIDLAEFKLLELNKFEEKSNEFKDKYLDFDNSDDSVEVINERDKILGYFELQIAIYINYFIDKLNIDGYTRETDSDYHNLKIHLTKNVISDRLTDTEYKLLNELLKRKYDIELLFTFNGSEFKYTSGFAKSSLNTIPNFKGISAILDNIDNNQLVKIKEEINEILI